MESFRESNALFPRIYDIIIFKWYIVYTGNFHLLETQLETLTFIGNCIVQILLDNRVHCNKEGNVRTMASKLSKYVICHNLCNSVRKGGRTWPRNAIVMADVIIFRFFSLQIHQLYEGELN